MSRATLREALAELRGMVGMAIDEAIDSAVPHPPWLKRAYDLADLALADDAHEEKHGSEA